jgi:hypothetical protein
VLLFGTTRPSICLGEFEHSDVFHGDETVHKHSTMVASKDVDAFESNILELSLKEVCMCVFVSIVLN